MSERAVEGDLPRRGRVGVALGPGGVVAWVDPGGPAALAGVRDGDRVRSVDGVVVTHGTDFGRAVGAVPPGARCVVTLERDGALLDLALTPTPRPLESHEGLEVRYGVARSSAGRLRTLAVRPEGTQGPLPCVYYLPGHPCASVDRPGSQADTLRDFVASLAREGFVVWRTDKRGTGDSEGPPCADATLQEEREDLAAGLDALERDPWVDGSQVVLFGHSLGALHAPALARGRASVRALALYGAGVKTWTEYLDLSRRRQLELAGVDPADLEDVIRERQRFDALVLHVGMSVEEVLSLLPALAARRALHGVDAEGRIEGRRGHYWRAVQAEPVVRPLRAAGLPVLAAWGSADWLSHRDEHVALAELVERSLPGGGRFEEIAGADHGFASHPDERASFTARGEGRFNPEVTRVVARWLRETLGR